MMDSLRSYRAFVRALEAGSFSAVARELGTSQSAVSKQIVALETSFGVQLFTRTTRRLQPTGEALQLYEHVRRLLDAVEALKPPGAHAATAGGPLRVTIPSSYGRHRICPKIPRFLEAHPQVRIEIVLTDRVLDLVEEGLDLGVRIGALAPSTLMARKIGTIEHVLVASPEYLERHGTPESPLELADHSCIVYGAAARWTRWEFESESGRHVVRVTGPARVSDPDAMYDFVRSGHGIALIPDWLIGDDISAGRTCRLLPDYYPLPRPVSVVYPATRFLSQRARSFIDFVLAEHAGDR